jgi:predicted aconitase with swiveling domain
VDFVKDSVSKGKVLHRIILKSAKADASPDAILSEGEYRIVVIAAFLADVLGRKANVPFIFDDPISSLDQDYEEAVVQRIIELSLEQQIIVFTHRLSFLGSIRHYADKKSVKYSLIYVRAIGETVGEPSALPTSQSEIKSALGRLGDERIQSIKRLQANHEYEQADIQIQSVCSEFRTLIERSIENDLLCGVVQRFQRPVSTLKLKDLAKLTKEDCAILDSLMTKYSGFEHSQSLESPVKLPSVEDIANDIKALKDWRDGYSKRVPPRLPEVSFTKESTK